MRPETYYIVVNTGNDFVPTKIVLITSNIGLAHVVRQICEDHYDWLENNTFEIASIPLEMINPEYEIFFNEDFVRAKLQDATSLEFNREGLAKSINGFLDNCAEI